MRTLSTSGILTEDIEHTEDARHNENIGHTD